jgi:hypothetical protein
MINTKNTSALSARTLIQIIFLFIVLYQKLATMAPQHKSQRRLKNMASYHRKRGQIKKEFTFRMDEAKLKAQEKYKNVEIVVIECKIPEN